MFFYFLYRVGYFLANNLPLTVSYFIACVMADVYYLVAIKEKEAIMKNLEVILDRASSEEERRKMARNVFRNFAKYLADFFRFPKVDEDYIKKFVKIEGTDNLDKALSKGKGVIILSAHIGNWELGGIVLSLTGYPMSAVVLTHQNKKINDFFTRQRIIGKLRPIEIGMSLRACYNLLRENRLLALLGDRDFTKKNGLDVEFFGKPTSIPKGPAVFSHRLGSAIVPSFMIREKNDTFRLVLEEPIFPEAGEPEDISITKLMKSYSSVIESYVRRYPTQWYMFREVWNDNGRKDSRPDSII